MPLSKYLKNNPFFSFDMNGSMVLLLVLLQMAAWYPFLSQVQDDVNRHTKLKNRADKEWRQTQKQALHLRDIRFADIPWVQHRITAIEDGIPTQWLVEGSASLMEWQGLLEKVETQFALVLRSVYWQREANGHWQGRLLFGINLPKDNREYHHWLPTKLRADRFNENDWQLLSTMRVGKNTSALLTYKNSRHWIRQGSWLPEAGVTVNAVSFDRVILMAKDGSQQALVVREKGGQDE